MRAKYVTSNSHPTITLNFWFLFGFNGSVFEWGSRRLIVNNAPWGRTWANRTVYVHPRTQPCRDMWSDERPSSMTVHVRTDREREAERNGREHAEEHKRTEKRR
jgi:hypothetical protein